MYHHSHFGVYALIQSNDRVLLIKKSRGPYTGLYDLPGGSQEDGELLEQTLIREIMEETDCTVTSHHQIGAFDTLYPYNSEEHGQAQLRHVGVIYKATIQGTPRTEPDGHDSNGCEWVDIKQIKAHPDQYTPFVHQSLEN